MKKKKKKEIVGVTSLEEALKEYASKSKKNKEVLEISLKMQELINQIVDERMYLKMTQRDLADMTGIKQPMIARIEQLESIPRLDTFLRLANNLDLELFLAYKVDFSPLNIGIKSVKYVSSDTVGTDTLYNNNQIVYGRMKNEQTSNAA